ncbi:MAG TPA: hypothetical protein VLG46_10345 [Anaerolineae bacterium]|nr:hypothetical protein [Anaerolineales bacterium]HSD84251.1 hypothetical protein [Anaerolineae bacterium]
MKTISIFLALVNALLAGLLIASSLSPIELGQAQVWWLVIKIVAAACVILIGIITWLGNVHSANLGLMALCSLFLVALGAATVVWTFHLALVTGDMEFHMIIYGGSLAVQGMTSLFGFAGDVRSVAV